MKENYELLKEMMLEYQTKINEFRKTLDEKEITSDKDGRRLINIMCDSTMEINDNLDKIDSQIARLNK